VRTSEPEVSETGQQQLPFWLSPASYWLPEHIVTSAWLTHAPFAFWLVDVLRPRSIVELGTHHGFSCFVFAEAVRRLSLETTIDALDSWEGDDHAGHYGEEVYQSVRRVVDSDYPEIVRLIRGYFDQSRAQVPDASVDLLHIDGRHGYDDVRSDYLVWRSAVRDRGLVLFHDIAEHQEGFGVWKLWEELSAQHPSFAFDHGHGLGLLAIGDIPDERIAALMSADEATAARIRSDYVQRGEVVARQSEFEAMPAEIDSLHETVDVLTAEIDRLRSIERENRDLVEAIHASTSWRVTRALRAVGRLGHRHG
jgi:hypothetical protein